VKIVFRHSWEIIVYDQRRFMHICTTNQKVGGNENLRRARLEMKLTLNGIHSVLVPVTMDDIMISASHLVREPVHFVHGIHKDDTMSDGFSFKGLLKDVT
jgi:hypothetical protein